MAAIAAFLCIAATSINDPDLKFRAIIPDGFDPNPEGLKGKDVIYSYKRAPKEPGRIPAVVVIERMRGMLPVNPPMESFTRGGVRFEMTAEKWKSYTVASTRAVHTAGDQRVLVLSVQVPLKPEAIQINVGGDEGDEQELRAVLRSVLASVEGQTNWADRQAPGGGTTGDKDKAWEADVERKEQIVRAVLWTGGVLVAVALLLYIGVKSLLRRRRVPHPRPERNRAE